MPFSDIRAVLLLYSIDLYCNQKRFCNQKRQNIEDLIYDKLDEAEMKLLRYNLFFKGHFFVFRFSYKVVQLV